MSAAYPRRRISRATLRPADRPLPAALSLAARRLSARMSAWCAAALFLVGAKVATVLRADRLFAAPSTRWRRRARTRMHRRAGRADRRLRPAARRLLRLRRAARRGVRRGAAARGAAGGAARPSSTCTRCRCASTSTGRPAGCRASSTAAPRASQIVLRLAVFNIMPTLLEMLLVAGILWRDVRLALRAASPSSRSALYIGFTLGFTNWRVRFRRTMNDTDNDAQTKAHRQPAELRDGQVFRQRGARGAPLRRGAGALRARRGAQPGHAEHAEPGPGDDHRRAAWR